ncbi:MAG: alpha/beta hydrolase family protein, partial [Candidatus Binatia bacterium]
MRFERSLVFGLATLLLVAGAARAETPPACLETERPDPSNPALVFQREAFGFHDEEIVVCSPGADSPTHIAVRLWVPKACVDGACAGVVIGHGFGFSKEVTFADAYAAVGKGLYVLAYDVRGQGASGGQAQILGRDDVADQAAVLDWWHRRVRPTKTAFYGISQGGWLSWTAAIFNCGAARAAVYDSTTACDEGGRWVDAIAPMQAPMSTIDDGTCTVFGVQAFAESRGNLAIAEAMKSCPATGQPGAIEGAFVDVSA